ncbi:MAG: hydrogenase maturation nickel metallochaperone HypA [archaeon]|nr:hydrogenase maturation nickel metallochaperone HypA [archaeon]
MSDLISAITKKLGEYSVEAVEEVTLVIGDLTNLGEEQMEFAYEIMIKGTKLEGSRLVIEHEKINVRCELCGYNGRVKEIRNDYTCHSVPILSCPKCGGDVIVTAGQSCAVKSISVVETG